MVSKPVAPSLALPCSPADEAFETTAPSAGLSPQDEMHDRQAVVQPVTTSLRKAMTLKMRAVGYLSRREYARSELAQKLSSYAVDPDELAAVLDALEQEGWLSTERFAQSLVHRRALKHGTARIVQALRQHGVAQEQLVEWGEQLRTTEHARALEVWRKRFGSKPTDPANYAKQARFLAGRGFAQAVIRRILGSGGEDEMLPDEHD